eukprot:7105021-Prymnesium_polylepis.1
MALGAPLALRLHPLDRLHGEQLRGSNTYALGVQFDGIARRLRSSINSFAVTESTSSRGRRRSRVQVRSSTFSPAERKEHSIRP